MLLQEINFRAAKRELLEVLHRLFQTSGQQEGSRRRQAADAQLKGSCLPVLARGELGRGHGQLIKIRLQSGMILFVENHDQSLHTLALVNSGTAKPLQLKF